MLPIVAFWDAINVVVLFLVCMMSLQAPVRRGEERFSLDEPIWIFAANGTLSTGRTKNLSLSGAALIADQDRTLVSKVGERSVKFSTTKIYAKKTKRRTRGTRSTSLRWRTACT